ncbi:hypothetical protein LUZ60_002802 [Juncus effusus]|nr:hypothetical protein LUZ60_002802 [Juncus effusus]
MGPPNLTVNTDSLVSSQFNSIPPLISHHSRTIPLPKTTHHIKTETNSIRLSSSPATAIVGLTATTTMNPNPPSSPPSPLDNYYCFICNDSVSLPASTSPLRCPRCMHEFLSDRPPSPPPPPPPPSHFHYRSRSSSSSSSPSPPSSPSHAAQAYLRRLIRQISSDDSNPLPIPIRRGPAPATPAAISAIPAVRVSECSVSCAVCKDEFILQSEARRLPCSHLYHSDCIVPWLQLRNSCPVCRSPVSSSRPEPPPPPVGTTTHVSIQFRTLFDRMDNVEEERNGARALRVALSQISRRQRSRVRRVEVSLSQLAQDETGGGSSGPATSGETVSSGRPDGLGFGGGGGVDEDGDTVMSDARES